MGEGAEMYSAGSAAHCENTTEIVDKSRFCSTRHELVFIT